MTGRRIEVITALQPGSIGDVPLASCPVGQRDIQEPQGPGSCNTSQRGLVSRRPAVRPPSTGRAMPLMYADSSLSSQAMALATSSGRPKRRAGMRSAMASRSAGLARTPAIILVWMSPGQTALNRTRWPYSRGTHGASGDAFGHGVAERRAGENSGHHSGLDVAWADGVEPDSVAVLEGE